MLAAACCSRINNRQTGRTTVNLAAGPFCAGDIVAYAHASGAVCGPASEDGRRCAPRPTSATHLLPFHSTYRLTYRTSSQTGDSPCPPFCHSSFMMWSGTFSVGQTTKGMAWQKAWLWAGWKMVVGGWCGTGTGWAYTLRGMQRATAIAHTPTLPDPGVVHLTGTLQATPSLYIFQPHRGFKPIPCLAVWTIILVSLPVAGLCCCALLYHSLALSIRHGYAPLPTYLPPPPPKPTTAHFTCCLPQTPRHKAAHARLPCLQTIHTHA